VLLFLTAHLAGAAGLGWLAKKHLPPRDRTVSAILPVNQPPLQAVSASLGAVCVDPYPFSIVELDDPGDRFKMPTDVQPLP
jgi:hypothetical protein